MGDSERLSRASEANSALEAEIHRRAPAATVLADRRWGVADRVTDIPPSAYGVAFPLAWVGGYVDAVGFLTLAGLFVAHMSGNTIRLGVFVGDGEWGLAAQRLVPILVSRSASGAASPSARYYDAGRRRRPSRGCWAWKPC
jgi:Protein of unknown function (DUF1275)